MGIKNNFKFGTKILLLNLSHQTKTWPKFKVRNIFKPKKIKCFQMTYNDYVVYDNVDVVNRINNECKTVHNNGLKGVLFFLLLNLVDGKNHFLI